MASSVPHLHVGREQAYMGNPMRVISRGSPLGAAAGTARLSQERSAYSAELRPMEVEAIEVEYDPRRGVSDEQAEREIIDFVAANPGSDTFDMATGLQLPFALVERAVERLTRQGVLRQEV